ERDQRVQQGEQALEHVQQGVPGAVGGGAAFPGIGVAVQGRLGQFDEPVAEVVPGELVKRLAEQVEAVVGEVFGGFGGGGFEAGGGAAFPGMGVAGQGRLGQFDEPGAEVVPGDLVKRLGEQVEGVVGEVFGGFGGGGLGGGGDPALGVGGGGGGKGGCLLDLG